MAKNMQEEQDGSQPLYISVARDINKYIIINKKNPGEKLPSEDYFHKELKVSRAVVREAVKLLVALGLVRAQTGSGLYVDDQTTPLVSVILDPVVPVEITTVIELYEYRIAVETATATYAAERITHRELQLLEDAVSRNQISVDQDDQRAFRESDADLHRLIAIASHNRPLASAVAMVTRLQTWVFDIAAGGPLESRAILAEQHRGIFQAIEQGEAALAAQRMREHLETARDNYKRLVADRIIRDFQKQSS